MLGVSFKFNDYIVSSVEEYGLEELNTWIRVNNNKDNICYSLDNQMFYRKVLEYYVTESEFFLKVYRDGEIVGVFKGNLELEGKKELLIWLFVIKKN